ncbi:MAG TPA: hypothetical protein VGU20_08650 [Stellaceae bacterium]|nr:hypothetical protein [Stellaceae bacterium]
MQRCASLFLVVLALAGCAERERPPPPNFAIPPVPAIAEPAHAAAGASAVRPVLPPRADVQYFLPSHPEDVMRGPAPVPRPGANTTPFYAAPANPGPVTGFGPGGMAQPPGAPANPPYPPAGLMPLQ